MGDEPVDVAVVAIPRRNIAARRGRVYVDFLQNGHGKLLARPFSARPKPGATVSTPLAWSEVDTYLDPRRFTIRTVPQRQREREQPLLPVLTFQPNIGRALEAARL